MLQLNSQAAQAALAQNGDGRLGGGVREAAELPAVPSVGRLPPAGAAGDFAALQAATLEAMEPLAAQEAAEQSAADETPAPAADVEQAPQMQQPPQPAASVAAQPEPIAEQWLLGMLGQRAVQVEARDGGETGRALDDSQAAVPASASQWRSSTLLAQAPVNPASPSSEAAAPQRAVLVPLDSQLPGQLERSSSQTAAVSAEAGKAAAPRVAGPEPLDGQLLAQLERLSGQTAGVSAEAGKAAAKPTKILSEAATPQVAGPEPLDGQLLAQLERLSGQAAGVSAEAGKAAANPTKILSEAATPKVAGPEPLDGQLLAQLERLSGQAAAAPSEAGSAGVGAGQAAQAPGLERTLKLQAPEVKWGEQMLHALRETVELQLQQRVQHTTIRLDPPELGSLEIFLSHESGRLSVQISAAQGDVARLLQQTSERLRQELVGQNFMQVSVQVSSDGQPGQPHERQARARLFDEEPVMAGSLDAEQPEQGSASRAGDVLITV